MIEIARRVVCGTGPLTQIRPREFHRSKKKHAQADALPDHWVPVLHARSWVVDTVMDAVDRRAL